MSGLSIPTLFETMRSEEGAIPRLGRHLDRIAASSKVFGIPFDRGEVMDKLARGGRGGLHRVRLALHPDGTITIDWSALRTSPFRTAWICPVPMVEAGTLRCQHKTTDREHYESRWREALARGSDEAIVLNLGGAVVEGTRTSVWAELEGGLWTPPLTAGGLPGVERDHLLATHPRAGERTLAPEDLWRADALFLSNALRGLMPVELVSSVQSEGP